MQLLPRQLPSHVLSSRNMEKQRRLIRFDNFDQIVRSSFWDVSTHICIAPMSIAFSFEYMWEKHP